MTDAAAAVRLLEAEPSIGQYLSSDEHTQALGLVVPTQVVARGPIDMTALLDAAGAFAALVLDGMLVTRLQVGEQTAIRLVGPGDVLSPAKPTRSMLVSYADSSAVTETRIAVLGREVQTGVQHWPGLLAGLHGRLADQEERVAAQLVICQLPRVDQRLLAIMWLLAESWGRVTPVGTVLPLSLTHDVLGGLIGARRSTVTLALGELAERGAMIRQEQGWLLLEEPPAPSARPGEIELPQLETGGTSAWRLPETEAPGPKAGALDGEATRAAAIELRETVRRLREEHERTRQEVYARLERLSLARARVQRDQPR